MESPRAPGLFAKVAGQDWSPALLLFLCDVICWVGIYGSLVLFRRDVFFSSGFEFFVIDAIQLAVIVQALFIIGGYSSRTEMRGLTYTAEHILAMIAALAVSSLFLYAAASFDKAMKPSRGAVLVSFVVFTPVSLLYRRALRKRVATASASRAFLVIGAGEMAANFYNVYCSSENQQRLEFVGLDLEQVGQKIAGPESPVVGGDLFSKLRDAPSRYSGIILAEQIERIGSELLAHLIRLQFQRTRVYTLESFYEAQWRRVPVHSIDPFWPLQMGFQLSRSSPYHYLKRLFDLIASSVLLVICAPLIALLACLIWLTAGRPAIFRQARVGREGEIFTAYKFRTMKTAVGGQRSEVSGSQGANFTAGFSQKSEVGGRKSETGDSALAEAERPEVSGVEPEDIYTREGDPRITRVGRWLRKLRLDELPQLWNVFNGEMSLIGPRAEWTKCAERYEQNIPFYHFRHLVKPGITGWAQVNYPYGDSDEDAVEKLKYDLYYIRHYSLTLDAMIVLKTIHTMLFGKGR